MIKAGKWYAWKVRRGQQQTDFELCKLIFGFIPPLFPTYYKEAGYISLTIENTLLSENGKSKLLETLNNTFKDFLKSKSDYETITKILS